jgi:hypothetical protein
VVIDADAIVLNSSAPVLRELALASIRCVRGVGPGARRSSFATRGARPARRHHAPKVAAEMARRLAAVPRRQCEPSSDIPLLRAAWRAQAPQWAFDAALLVTCRSGQVERHAARPLRDERCGISNNIDENANWRSHHRQFGLARGDCPSGRGPLRRAHRGESSGALRLATKAATASTAASGVAAFSIRSTSALPTTTPSAKAPT